MDSSLIPWLFASVMLVGVIYMLVSLIFGELIDFDGDFDLAPDLDLDVDASGLDLNTHTSAAGEGFNIGCASVAAFLASFGAMGLVGTLSGVSLIGSLAGATVLGLLIGRLAMAAIAYLKTQESTRVSSERELIGRIARVTINSPAGKVGEVMIEAEQLLKFPVKEIHDAALHRGDTVNIIDISGGTLLVEKQADSIRMGS
ncbi:MAG TPA: hypothetical protein VJZ27_12515 [Aggregatilineales bacterium]|nr:hypothetical protein [Aggregatilineales bacterium]